MRIASGSTSTRYPTAASRVATSPTSRPVASAARSRWISGTGRDESSHGCELSRSRLASCRSSASSFTTSSASRLPPSVEAEASAAGLDHLRHRPAGPLGGAQHVHRRDRLARSSQGDVLSRSREMQHQVVGLDRSDSQPAARWYPSSASRAAVSARRQVHLVRGAQQVHQGHRLAPGRATGARRPGRGWPAIEVLRAELLDRQHVRRRRRRRSPSCAQPGDDLAGPDGRSGASPAAGATRRTGSVRVQPRPGAVHVAAGEHQVVGVDPDVLGARPTVVAELLEPGRDLAGAAADAPRGPDQVDQRHDARPGRARGRCRRRRR